MADKQKSDKKIRLIKDINLTALGWELAIPIFGGAFLGYKLDQHFSTSYIFTIVFLLAGISIGYFGLYKLIEIENLRLKVSRHDKDQKGSNE